MKKFVVLIGLALTLSLMSFTNETITPANYVSTVDVQSSTFKVINDTGSKVKLKHKGGSVSLNNGGSTSISCKREGNVIYINGNALHTVSSSDCGKTYKISSWM